MQEWVGTCQRCQKDVYCHNGFFHGIVQEDGTILCFACAEEEADVPEQE